MSARILTPSAPSSAVRPAASRRRRRAVALVASVTAAAVVATGIVLSLAGSAPGAGIGRLLPPELRTALFDPTTADGFVDEFAPISLADDAHPAISGLDDALRTAMRSAEDAAARDGIRFAVTGGWRSREYQQWLLDTRIAEWGSEAAAREFVATPDSSRHVTGDAVDIGSVDAQYWLVEHGWQWGICQTYANEPWHFELATAPGGVCPEMRLDATG